MKLACSLAVCALLVCLTPASMSAQCGESGVALQILGSAGPDGLRGASSGYLVWIEGESRIMVDAGGGTFARLHEAGARVPDLELLALSHFHPDHSAEVPALLWTQPAELRIAGPSGTETYPSTDQFLNSLFTGSDALFSTVNTFAEFDSVTVDVSASEPVEVFSDGDVRVLGVGVPHFDIPTVGYRVDVGDASIGFASDQIGTNRAFVELIRDVDVLVVHFAASEEPGAFASGHARPSVWGQMAATANVKRLVLSHISEVVPSDPRFPMSAGSDFAGNVALLRSHYTGPLTVAEDLMCMALE